MRWISHCRFLLVVGTVGLCALGCEPYEARLAETGATLEGTVTMGGNPLPAAMVILVGKEGSATGNLSSDGRFKIDNAPLGEVKIAVNTEAAKGQMMGEMMSRGYQASKGGKPAEPAPKFVDVPKKYWDPNTSGITTTINKGPNTYDVKL